MGLFSKKNYVCTNCGKTFQARLAPTDGVCDACINARVDEKISLQLQIMGYVKYRYDFAPSFPDYTPEEMKTVIRHRNSILEKYRIQDGISVEEFAVANNNFKLLSEDEAFHVMRRVFNSLVHNTAGAAFSKNFFTLTNYNETIVDVEDVFAVCYCSDYNIKLVTNDEVILCGVFTNDPYIPVFPIVFTGKKGSFELMKSKKGRQGVQEFFTAMCPNLTYPVCDVKNFKNMIKNETTIKGNIPRKVMLEKISEVSMEYGIFNTKNMLLEVLPNTADMLHKDGYIMENEVNNILNMNPVVNYQFWTKVVELMAARNE